jgi:pantoate--beta-alanine ligase
MIRTEKIEEVKQYVRQWKREGLSIGLVPTMGYLHEGHASLIKKAREDNDRVIVSDFVNPIQFGPKEDLAVYPRDFEKDCALCESLGADLIFHPDADEMYYPTFCTHVKVESLTTRLCGVTRPFHFQGVCTVVSKLFHISEADRAYFGQKDAQQLSVIRRMVRDLNFPIEIIGCPIIREDDGLAKSSRNTYLNEEERKSATVLYKSLKKGHEMIDGGEKNAKTVANAIRSVLESEPRAKIDYIEIVDWEELQPVETIDRPVLVAIAVYIGKDRLIDNFITGSLN